MDLDSIIKLPRHHKKTFLALLLLLFILSLVTAGTLGLSGKEILLEQVKSVASALITALIGLILISMFVPTTESGEITEVQPGDITKEFEKLLKVAVRWRYKGNFGRYLRGKILPSLVGKQNVHVTACLIDPTDESLCEQHAEYRGSINAIDKGSSITADTVAIEVVVTILIAAWYMTNRNMEIKIFLSKSYEPMRIDSSDDAMIVTVEDRRSPALKISKGHFTYDHFELQMKTAREQSREIRITGIQKNIELSEITKTDVANVLKAAGMSDLCNRLGSDKILEAIKQSKNPYEN